MTNVYLIEGARTPFGTFGGSLKDVGPAELGIAVSKEAIRRSGIPAEVIDLSVLGNVIHSEKNAPYLSRHVALQAGIPLASPALTVNRLCGSGLQSVVSAAQSILLGEASVALAGGVENMSQSPMH